MKYVIAGDPSYFTVSRSSQKDIFNNQKYRKVVTEITIASQHDERPMYDGKIHVDFTFYLRSPKSKRYGDLEGAYDPKIPDLLKLVKFIEDVATGILYKNSCIICSVSAKKRYSRKPRTEFEVKIL